MMMQKLPVELVEEILYRVPATSLKRLRSSCKQWNALFYNQRFTHKHFRTAPKESMILMLKDVRVFPDDKLVVWNPCLRETRWIQLKADYKKQYSRFALGYKNNKSCRSYKILRCWRHDINERFYDVSYEIYEFSSDSWKVFDKFSLQDSIVVKTGVSLKGNSYWFTAKNKLLSFDFKTESFKPLRCLPPPVQDCDWIILSVVREEQISVIHQNYSNIDIWMSNNIDDTQATLSWRKSFSVELKLPTNFCFYLICPLSFLIDEEKKVVVCFKRKDFNSHMVIMGEDGAYYTEHSLVSSETWTEHPCIFNYVTSLVRIQ
ncbi:putative F-box only protein 9 [Capsella rubella]|uniref:putative F-box only protein 9 n=1 Tax=Capsella rubella TaxID=81985 RepID=UPI000CD59379|nr:putative F-box only protein 9 [Capsella rubella]